VVLDVATSQPVKEFATGSAVYAIAFLDRPRSLVTHGKGAVFLFGPASDAPVLQIETSPGDELAITPA